MTKFNAIPPFEKYIKQNQRDSFPPLFLIVAKEDDDKETVLKPLLEKLLEGLPSSALHTLDCAGEVKIKEIYAELDTIPFFEEKIILYLKNVDNLTKNEKESLQKYFAAPNSKIVLLMTASSLAVSTRFFKAAAQEGVTLALPIEKSWEKEKRLQKWLIDYAKKNKVSLDFKAAEQLVKRIGCDSLLLKQEMEKLLCYIGKGKEITLKEINAVSLQLPQENIWQLAEAIFSRDSSRAIKVLHSLMSEGVTIFSLLPLLRKQFQTGYQLCAILTGGGGVQEVTGNFPYMKGAILQKNISQAENYGATCYREGIIDINEADLISKNSSVDPLLLIEKLILKLATRRKL